ncbi:MAG: hypothetical protein HQL52_07840, partial [Magnetococcales bacterium]|nr:hypothetical protein [Magnetococcales bacterium]
MIVFLSLDDALPPTPSVYGGAGERKREPLRPAFGQSYHTEVETGESYFFLGDEKSLMTGISISERNAKFVWIQGIACDKVFLGHQENRVAKANFSASFLGNFCSCFGKTKLEISHPNWKFICLMACFFG